MLWNGGYYIQKLDELNGAQVSAWHRLPCQDQLLGELHARALLNLGNVAAGGTRFVRRSSRYLTTTSARTSASTPIPSASTR